MATSHLTLKDIAREAGVSVATLDRVLHGRPAARGHRPEGEGDDGSAWISAFRGGGATGARPVKPVRLRDARRLQRLHAVDPRQCRRNVRLARRRRQRRDRHDRRLQPRGSPNPRESLAGRYDGVAVVALDHQSVRAAIDDLVAGGTYVVTLVSTCPASAAITTSGSTTSPPGGRRAPSWGVSCARGPAPSRWSRARSRCATTRSASSASSGDQPGISAAWRPSPVEGGDRDDVSETLMARLLAEHPDLIGVYNVGAGA